VRAKVAERMTQKMINVRVLGTTDHAGKQEQNRRMINDACTPTKLNHTKPFAPFKSPPPNPTKDEPSSRQRSERGVSIDVALCE
jgi:hypothetical protein